MNRSPVAEFASSMNPAVESDRQEVVRFSLTAVVLAKNEAHNIERCLKSLEWCAERVVVDDSSSDETVTLARSHGARILSRQFDTFAGQRNWALEHGDL